MDAIERNLPWKLHSVSVARQTVCHRGTAAFLLSLVLSMTHKGSGSRFSTPYAAREFPGVLSPKTWAFKFLSILACLLSCTPGCWDFAKHVDVVPNTVGFVGYLPFEDLNALILWMCVLLDNDPWQESKHHTSPHQNLLRFSWNGEICGGSFFHCYR